MVGVGALGFVSCAPVDPCADTPANRDRAMMATEGAVKERLRSPATAQFPKKSGEDGVQVVRIDACRFLVISHVDSQNGFGALVRSSYSAYLTANKDRTFTVDKLTIVQD